MYLENRPKAELDKYIGFYQALGLPTTLAELHLAGVSEEELLKIGTQATIEGETIHQMPFAITASDVADALKGLDAYVKMVFPK